jgi:hypothetical protein
LLTTIAFFTAFLFSSFSPSDSEGDWELVTSFQGVNAYAKIVNCEGEDHPYYSLKFENTNTKPVSLNYSLEIPKSPVFGTLNGEINNLSAGSSISGDCADKESGFILAVAMPADKVEDLIISGYVTFAN